MIEIVNSDNMLVDLYEKSADVVFADYVYEDENFSWVDKYWESLKVGGLFFAMTDYHTYAEYTVYMKKLPKSNYVSTLHWISDWGRKKEDRWRDVIDYVIVFSKGSDFKFYPDRVQVPKKTISKGLNPSGRTTKIGTNLIEGVVLTTTAKERMKTEDGHLIRWQKPLALYDYLLKPTTDVGDLIVDPFMGSGTCGVWAKKNDRDYFGVEIDGKVYEIAKNRIEETQWEKQLSMF